MCGDTIDLINGVPTGSVRISFGYMSTKYDVDAVFDMIEKTYLRNASNSKIEVNFKNMAINLKPLHITNSSENDLHDFNKIKLKEICVYPIKSCGSFKVQTKWPITSRGLKYDREWMIITSNGVCMTQKSNSKLCLITPIIDVSKGLLILNFPYASSISIPLHPDEQQQNILASLCQSKVCGDRIQGIDCGDNVAEWLSDVLCTSDLRLIRQSSCDTRTLKVKKGKKKNRNHFN